MRGFEELSMSGFPSAEVILLWQSVFNFPNWLFHECLVKNQANHNLSFDECKIQGSGWRLKHTRCFAKEILQVSPQYSVFLTSAFPWSLIPYSTYARTYFVSKRQWNTFNERWIVIVVKWVHMNFIRTVWSIHNCKNSTI